MGFRFNAWWVHQIIPILTPPVRGLCLSASVNVSLVRSLGQRIRSESYCIQSRFQLSLLRLLDEDVLVVDVLDDVYVAVFGVDLHDDGFDGGITGYEYALTFLSVHS